MSYQRIKSSFVVMLCAAGIGCSSTSFEQATVDLATGVYTSQEMRRDKNGQVERNTQWDLTVGAFIASFKALSRSFAYANEALEPEASVPCNLHKRSALDCGN